MNSADEVAGPVRRTRWWLSVAAVLVVVGGIGGVFWLRHDRHSTASTMAARAQQVMPFDLDRTKHTFAKTAEGGVETVVVIDPADSNDLALIRSHLQMEAENFRAGNYSDPARIHGMNMPGMQELEQGASRVSVVYAETPTGAQVTYTSSEPTLILAIHDWFDRQTLDHSMTGMGG